MAIPARERKTRAMARRLPPGEERDRVERIFLPDRAKAVERFRLYAARAERELMAWELNWMSERIVNLLGEDIFALVDEIKAEEAERKRMEGKLKVVKGKRKATSPALP